MREENTIAPVPVPPVDESWSLMRSALDARMPVLKAPVGKVFYMRPRFLGMVLAGAVLTVVFFKVVVRSGHSSATFSAPAPAPDSSTRVSFPPSRPTMSSVTPSTTAPASVVPSNEHPSTAVTSTARPSTATSSTATPSAAAPTTEPTPSGKQSNTMSSVLPGKIVRIISNHAHQSTGVSGTHHSSVSAASPGSQNSRKSTRKKGVAEMDRRKIRGAASGSNDSVTGSNIPASGSNIPASGSNIPASGSNIPASGSNIPASGSTLPASRSNTPARRQTSPVGLAALSPAGGPASIRFRLADSLLRKRAMNPGNFPQSPSATAHALIFTAGLTLSGRLNLSQLQAAPYTINGSRNIWADYLPSVHARAYYGGNWDLQVDLTALQPQYTRSTVVDSTGGDSSTISPFQGYRQYNVYSAKKLFYSELSATVHHRVFNNLWLGAGFTYGHLQGAVGDRQLLMKATNPGVSDTVLTSEIVSIKSNDTAYNRISRSDWRFLLDAEYRWRRLTLGLRYERAVNSWLPVQPDGARGAQNNQSFTLRVSYELWRRR